jgi:hypothetical protein
MKKLANKQRLLQIQTKHLLIFGIVITVACIVAWYGLAQAVTPARPPRLITFYDNGLERSVLTQASTVRNALRFAGISVDSHDIVDPSLDTNLTTSDANIIIYRSRPILVIDGAIRQRVMTSRQSANEITKEAGLAAVSSKDKTTLQRANWATDGATVELVVARAKPDVPIATPPTHVSFQPKPNALTKSKGAQVYVDANGVAHRETYYDLPMQITMRSCGVHNSYTIRSDGAKVDQDGYVLVAANLAAYPRCTIVDTSMGPGKVYDTGGFAARYPYGFDLATDWTNYDGR